MQGGHILRRPQNGEPVQIIEFTTYIIDLERFEKKDAGQDLKPRERYFHELVGPFDADDDVARKQPGLLRAEVHERFSSPLYPFAFVLIAVAFIGHARTTRQNRMQAIVTAFVLATGARLGGLGGTNVVALKASATWIVYAIPVGSALAALVMIAARRRLSPPSKLSLGLARAGASVREALRQAVAPRRPTAPLHGARRPL
jgi:lipopolysaccharide export system permease protein